MLEQHPGTALVTRVPGAPEGAVADVVEALVAREVVEDVLDRLTDLGVDRTGGVTLQDLDLMVSVPGREAEKAAPGDADDAVIWDQLVATTGDDSAITPMYLAFLVIACLLAALGVVTESPETIVGAMVVAPDFGPLAAFAVGVVGRRRDLVRRGVAALLAGYPLAIAVTTACTLLAQALGLFDPGVVSNLEEVSFVYHVGPASVAVALLAGAAGMLALTSQKSATLIGVFISVTTVPAAGFAAVAIVAGDWSHAGRALLQLLVNLTGVAIAGVVVLHLRRSRMGTLHHERLR